MYYVSDLNIGCGNAYLYYYNVSSFCFISCIVIILFYFHDLLYLCLTSLEKLNKLSSIKI